MAFQVKSRGRPNARVKMRGISGITPKGYSFHKYSRKHNALMFKKTK